MLYASSILLECGNPPAENRLKELTHQLLSKEERATTTKDAPVISQEAKQDLMNSLEALSLRVTEMQDEVLSENCLTLMTPIVFLP